MLQISTNNLNTRKKVEIDGHPYIVRKFGAGEQLTINQLIKEAKKMTGGSEADEARAEAMYQKMLDLYAGLFDDGEGGVKSKALVKTLDVDELGQLLLQIFPQESGNATEVS